MKNDFSAELGTAPRLSRYKVVHKSAARCENLEAPLFYRDQKEIRDMLYREVTLQASCYGFVIINQKYNSNK